MNTKASATAGRIVSLDLAKGLAMLMIIASHMDNPLLGNMTMATHIPVFYWISGYFLSDKRNLQQTIKNKWKALVVPYFWIAGIYLTVLPLKLYLEHTPHKLAFMIQALTGAVFGAANDVSVPWHIVKIGAIWYLLANFWGLILARWILEKGSKAWILAIALAVFSMESISVFWLPFSIQPGGVAVLYILAGYIWKKNRLSLPDIRTPFDMGVFIACLGVSCICTLHFGSFYLSNALMHSTLMNFLASWCNIYVILAFCGWLAGGTRPFRWAEILLDWIGRHSLIVLGVHFLELRLFRWYDWSAQIPFLAHHAHWNTLAILLAKIILDLCITWLFVQVHTRLKKLR